MSSELNQMYPVLPRGVTTPPGAVRIQLDGPDAANVQEVMTMLANILRRRASAETESRSKASEATSSGPEPEASAAAATEEIGEST